MSSHNTSASGTQQPSTHQTFLPTQQLGTDQAATGPFGFHHQTGAGPSGFRLGANQTAAGPSGFHHQTGAGPSGFGLGTNQTAASPPGFQHQTSVGPSGFQKLGTYQTVGSIEKPHQPSSSGMQLPSIYQTTGPVFDRLGTHQNDWDRLGGYGEMGYPGPRPEQVVLVNGIFPPIMPPLVVMEGQCHQAPRTPAPASHTPAPRETHAPTTPSPPNPPSAPPPAAPTPTGVQPANQGVRTRVTLTEENRLALLKLCNLHSGNYYHGNKTNFWEFIKNMLEVETGVLLKDPRGTVSDMIKERKRVVATEKKESGTVQEETELSQQLDRWISYVDEIEEKRTDSKKAASVQEKEKNDAAIVRRNMLVRYGKKRALDGDGGDASELEEFLDTGDDSDGAVDDEALARLLRDESKKKRKITNAKAAAASDKPSADTMAVVQAITEMNHGMVDILKTTTAAAGVSEWKKDLRSFEDKITKKFEDDKKEREAENARRDKQNDETKNMFAAIMERLGNKE